MDELCYRHPTVAAVAKCAFCQRPLCGECIMKAEGAILCGAECLAAMWNLFWCLFFFFEAGPALGPAVARFLRILILGAIAVAAFEFLGFTNFFSFF